MKPVEIEFLLKDHTESGLDSMSGNLSGVQAKAGAIRSAIASLEKQLNSLQNRKVSPDMDQSENLVKIEALKKKIAELRGELDLMEKEFPQLSQAASKVKMVPPDAGAVKSTYNGLHNSIQQIAREMPSLAMGPQMFFMAISNNLPVFTDELSRARKEYAALQAEGKKGVPVWRQVASSLFSWQTALTTGIMLLVMHGDKIADWVGKLFKGKNAAMAVTDALGDMNEAMDIKDVASKIASFEKLSRAYKALGDDANAKKQFLKDYRDEIDETGISVNNIQEADNLFITNSAAFVESVKQRAMALAGIKLATEQYEKALKQDDKDRENLRAHETRLETLKNKPSDYTESTTVQTSTFGTYSTTIHSRDELIASEEATIAMIKKRSQAYTDAGNAYIDAANKMSDVADKTLEGAGLEEIDDSKAEAEEDKKTAEELRQREEMLKKVAELEAKAEADVSDMTVEAMKKGYEKERAEAKNHFEQEKQRIQKELEERLALYSKLREAGAAVPDGAEERTRALAATQTVKAGMVYDSQISAIDAREVKDTEDKLNKLLEKYRDFETQRKAVREQGAKDTAALEKARTEENSEEIDRAITVVKEQVEKGIKEINDKEAQASMKDNGFLKKLFGDYSQMSFKALQELVSQARELKSYLSGNTDASGITFISPEQLEIISNSPAELDKLKKALDKLLSGGTGNGSNRMSNIFKQFEEGLISLTSAKDISAISSGIAGITGAASSAAGELENMFAAMGNTEAADAVNGVQQVLGAVSNIGEGFAKGGVIGAIGAAVGEVAKLATSAIEAENRHQEAINETYKAKLSFQRQYNILLLEQNLLLEEASNIFGENQIKKAINAVSVYKDALSQLGEEIKGDKPTMLFPILSGTDFFKQLSYYKQGIGGLASAKIVTGHEKTGLFGWGKGRDVYSSIIDVYPELIDANGKLDTAMLQTILDTRKMSDETRAYLENLMSLSDVLKESEEALRDYLQATYGGLGDGIMDSVVAALDGSKGVLEGFAQSVGDVFADLGEQLAYSLFFAEEFDRLQKDLEEIYKSDKSEEDILNDSMNLIDKFYDGIGDNADAALEWMQEWQKKAAEKGFDVWGDDDKNGASQTGKAGAFTTMTQEQGTKLEGLFTAGQMHWANIDEGVDDIVTGLGTALSVLRSIEVNTRSGSTSLQSIKTLLAQMIRDGIKAK